jgi:hypothetical protein
MLLVYGYVAWVAFMATAIANGIFRVSVLELSINQYAAHLISTALLCAALFIEINVFLSIVGDYSQGWLIALGVMWMLLTVAFEFGFGRFIARQSWATLLENYNLLRGRVWPAVLLVLLLSPVLVG